MGWRGLVLFGGLVSAGCPRHGDRDPIENEHGASRRPLDDPKVARASGVITNNGRPVTDARIEATVHPTGMGWTIDAATSTSDGTFSIPITSTNLKHRQPVVLEVQADGLRGRAVITVGPGEIAEKVAIEVGPGLEIQGRVTDAAGTPAGRYDMGHVGVCLGDDCAEVTDDGAFKLTTFERGRHRLQVVAGGVTHSVKEVPLTKVSPRFAVDRLSGFIGPIALQIDGEAADRMFNAPSWSDSAESGTARVRVIPGRNASLPATIMCMTAHGGEDIAVGDGKTPLVVPTLRFGSRSRIDCDAGDSDSVRIYVADLNRVIDVPVVAPTTEDVDLGAELRSEPTGARVIDVADEAKTAGLRPGDIVTAIDGISVAGMNIPVVRALGFRLPPGRTAELTILRGTQELRVLLQSPPT